MVLYRGKFLGGKYKGFSHCAKDILATEGLAAFWKGCQAGLLRQAVFGTLRIGFYDYGQQRLIASKGEENVTLLHRAALGMTTGA